MSTIPLMVASSAPPIPPYRVTLFFGPEVRDMNPAIVYCVFNVKKRSWKGGVQIAVEMAQDQIDRCQRILRLESWLRNALRRLPREDCDEYVQRGRGLWLTYLCRTKLQLAIDNGLKQDTTLLSHDALRPAFEESIRRNESSIKAALLEELDVPAAESADEATAGQSMCRS